METKKCFKCSEEKPIAEFYKHKQMGDGYLNKCKECAKKDVKIKYSENIENPKYVEKERERGREKYKRLNYSERIQYKKEYSRKYRDANRYFTKLGYDLTGKEVHHWNYLFPKDVFFLSKRAHKLIHNEIKYCIELNCFVTNSGINLSTKKQHFFYIKSMFEKYNVNYEIESYPFLI